MNQHDDHVWLTVYGEAWAILNIKEPIIYLWRGYTPRLEYAHIDGGEIDWGAYCDEAAKLLRRRQ